ncbi:MAG: UDP-N-acetylglucosamine 1-carboxyvinyltransferase [Spirochaetales bacterium]
MHKYVIDGGHPLKGRIRANGNKNAALPCVAACLLTSETVRLTNVPEIEDILVMFDILRDLGSTVVHEAPNTFAVTTSNIVKHDISAELAKRVRASILFAGPMLARVGKVVLPPPGGDVIGRRRLDTHFLALSELGARFEVDTVYTLTANKLVGLDLFLDEASVTGTENAIMAAVLAEGKTILQNAAGEPHVQDLCNMLNGMGAKIRGIGSNILEIEGVKTLHGTEFRIGTDFMEVGSLIGLAACTHSELVIDDVQPQHLRMTKLGFAKLGIFWETEGSSIRVPAGQPMKIVSDMGGQIPKIDDSPWPGFPPDILPIMTVVATQCQGTILIHDKMFESRMFWVDKLIGMGAGIILCDPHRAVVSGASSLQGMDLVSPDVRAGMALVIASLAAEGRSTIQNVYQIERGYENIATRLAALGARIQRVKQD